MGFLDDLNDIFTLSRGGRRFLSASFVVSIVMDVDLVLSPILIGERVLSVHEWSPAIHAVVAVVEVPLAVATMLFWFLMMSICLRAKRGFLRSMLWIFAFVVGTIVTAQIYYFLVYRRSAAFAHAAKPLN